MNVVFLSKRRPQGRDLIASPYGRFFYLPLELSRLGMNTSLITVSYQAHEDCESSAHGVPMVSVSARPNLPGLGNRLAEVIRARSPDWIIGCSDTWFGILAGRIASRLNCRYAVDAYDNYCAYIPWLLPLHHAWFKAIREADCVTVAGPSLSEFLAARAHPKRPPVVIPMAADPDGYFLRDRMRCRAELGLPNAVPLVGYSGAISASRGIDSLFRVLPALRERFPGARLILTGRMEWSGTLPEGCDYLGYLPADVIPKVVNAVDVVTALNRDSAFGNFSFPAKLYEAMACQVPVVVSATQSTAWIMSDHPQLLVTPGDDEALLDAIGRSLGVGRISYANDTSWQDSAALLAASLRD